ncbi:transmembrane protein, putative (macronuclear) [Tetrahymena thermophila SB210]|uniref:Transmembrane protein, putative n=1 Tax=Tetrahymena thermophila (strain SB210) TaxID=312017 RepID=W7WZE7_TETTS|nr:transmembrane protein, putative [Tetrahymena thermophila SB210]EWS70977.1 transmembrane protein, putative [Tetrahymena thermophila SB210]|eukprot:XP_012656492.1 transmembrane protein, putative [Tetrahymena thermophila SB210]
MIRIVKQLAQRRNKLYLQECETQLFNKQYNCFFFKKSDSDQLHTVQMLKSLENSKSNIPEFRQQMETWIKNINNSDYLQQQLISDYYKQFSIVLQRRIQSFENNELLSWKSLNQSDLDNIQLICQQKIKFLEDSIKIREEYHINENLQKDKFKVFWWKIQKNKYNSPLYYKLIHYYPIYLLISFVIFFIVDLIVLTNHKRLDQLQVALDSQISQVKEIVGGIIQDSQKNIKQVQPESKHIQIAPIHDLQKTNIKN